MPVLILDRSTLLHAHAINELERNLLGQLILPGDDEYDSARRVHELRIDRRPSVIVRAAGAPDVIRAVKFARANGLALAVRSGGHSFTGFGVSDDGVVLDLSRMRSVSIDPARKIAWVQPGATSADIAEQAQQHGLALTTGDVSSVGIAGLTLGGGIGWLVRKFGLTIDHLRSVDVVTADGELITASADEHPDLFWAIRGGGGNFGVATGFEFRLEEVGTVYGGLLMLPATREVLRGWADFAPYADEGLTTICALMPVPPAPFVPEEHVGKVAFAILAVYTGDAAGGEKAMAPLRALAEPMVDMVAPMPYPAIYQFTAQATEPASASIRSMFLQEMPDGLIDALLEAASKFTSPISMIQLRSLGGAMSRVPAGATAFAHRDAKLMATVIGHWADATEGDVHRAWTLDTWAKVATYANGVYVNFLQDDGERLAEAYPDGTLARLAEVKRRYDPTNLFRHNQNITPRG
jgi:FAD/FMN-containing dehydrogenase